MKSFKEIRTELIENYNQDLKLATKNVARLSNKESGQDKKDYQAVSRALAQGNLAAVKKVIKGISTKEIQSDLLNILVGYNDLIAKMYPNAVDSKGNLKSGLTVDKMVKEDTIEEASLDQLKRKHKRHIDNFNKRNKDLPSNVEKDLMKYAMDNDGIGDDPDDFDDWLVQNIEEAKMFNSKKEVADVKKIDKLLEAAYKGMNKLQYGQSTYMMDVNDGIITARRALAVYSDIAANGEIDGPLIK